MPDCRRRLEPEPFMSAPSHRPANAWLFFTNAESRFTDGAASLLIPADELGPGAKEANVVCFIDRQLASGWGAGARTYRMCL